MLRAHVELEPEPELATCIRVNWMTLSVHTCANEYSCTPTHGVDAGMCVQCLGDFFQLEPITCGSLHSAVVAWAGGDLKPYNHETEIIAASKLFASVRKFELTQQMRSQDPSHTGWLDACRDTRTARPVTKEMLAAYIELSQDDTRSDANAMAALVQAESQLQAAPSPDGPTRRAAWEALKLRALLVKRDLWSTTPIAVTNNRTRHAINTRRIQDFAAQTRQPVLSWFNTLVGSIGQHFADDPSRASDLKYLRDRHPELKSSFVAGAPGHLLANMCPVKGYANGTPIIYHSLRFGSQTEEDAVTAAIKEWEHNGFDPKYAEIMVPVPCVINVQVPSVAATAANADERVDTAECLASSRIMGTEDSEPGMSRCVVIPVPLLHRLPNAGRNRYFTLELPRSQASWWAANKPTGKKATIPLNYQMHPVTVAFSLTYHKLQGQTRNKLILNMNKVPRGMNGISLRHIYVGFSRTKTRQGIRLFPMTDTSNKRHSHLIDKKHDEKLKTYLAGFSGDGTQYQRA